MSYTPNVPVSGQSLGASRPIINTNFSVIQTGFDVNHQDFNDSNPGTHKKVDLLSQSANPNPATGIVTHYSKAVSGVTEWFFQRENSGSVIQMSSGTPTAASPGITFLPGGILMQWGSSSTFGSSISFPTPFPNNLFSIHTTGLGLTAFSVDLTAASRTAFTAVASAVIVGQSFYWVAIGN